MSATDRNLTAAHAEVKAEITRTDTKTALLLAFVGAVLAGAWTIARDLPLSWPALLTGSSGMALLVAAAGLLLRSTRPNLRGRHGFPLWATLTPEQITEAVTRDLAADIAGLSRLAVTKFTCLRRAVDLTLIGGVLLILAVVIAVGGCGMSPVRRKRWRLVAAVLCVLAAVAAGVTAFVYSLPLPALAVAVGCFLVARYLRTESSGPLTMGPDNGDSEEWMGERFIWEPGDLDDGEAGR